MNVIALAGVSNTGKSRTLYLLGRRLIQEGAEVLLIQMTQQRANFFEGDPPWLANRSCDYKAIFNYKGKVICIGTRGDVEEEIERNIKFFEKSAKAPDVIFFASRTQGGTVSSIDQFAKKNNAERLLWVGKSTIKDDFSDSQPEGLQEKQNTREAEFLFGLIK